MATSARTALRRFVARVRQAEGRRSPAAWSSACLYLVACALLLAGAVAVPMRDQAAHPVDASLAGACALVAAVAWFGGPRLGRVLPHLVVILGVGVITAAIALSRTFGGETFPAFGYLWTTVYVAYFHRRRAVGVYVVVIAASFAVALAVAEVGPAVEAWIVVVASVVALAVVLHALVDLLARQAEHDPLTGALNRTGLEREVAALRPGWARRASGVAVVAVDLDGFKAVNDRVGHVAADGLLVELVRDWKGRLRESDLVGRVGGDEFVLVLGDTRAHEAEALVTELRQGSPLAWSAGITGLAPAESLENALVRADAELYRAKPGRRGRRPTEAAGGPVAG